MRISSKAILYFAAAALATLGVQAQPMPSGAPPGTTVECKDGSFASPEAKSGACSGHKGIKTWYGKADESPRVPWRLVGLSQAATVVT